MWCVVKNSSFFVSAWGIIECITNVRCDYYCFSASRSSTNVGFYSLSIARSGLVVAVYIYVQMLRKT